MTRRALLLLILWPAACARDLVPPRGGAHLVLCGGDEVFIIDPGGVGRKLWSWRAVERPEIPEAVRLGLPRRTPIPLQVPSA